MAKQFLHCAEVRARPQGMGGKRVAQQVRPRAVSDPDAPQVAVHQQGHSPHREAIAAAVEEQGRVVVLALGGTGSDILSKEATILEIGIGRSPSPVVEGVTPLPAAVEGGSRVRRSEAWGLHQSHERR